MNLISFPRNSNVSYLPLVYFLPEDVVSSCPTLRLLPRNLHTIFRSDDLMDIVVSDQFLNEIMDATAALAFPHFGFGGWKEHYTGFSLVWRLSYSLSLWRDVLELEHGWGLNSLLSLSRAQDIPFLDPDYIRETMAVVVKRGIGLGGLQPILDVQREMPCDEDFEKWDTNVRKDFIRKWYHTRSKRVQTISLEECMEDEEGHIHELEDTAAAFEESIIAEDFCERFKAMLSKKDMEILELRVMGHTFEEIAGRLGYKNHSGVIKRMAVIKKRFIEYESKYGQ